MAIVRFLDAFIRDDEAQGLVEYALILFLISLVVIVALTALGKRTNDMVSNIGETFEKSGKGVCGSPPCGKGGGKGPG